MRARWPRWRSAGNPIATAAFERAAEALGLAIAGAVTLLDLDLVVIGGGVAGAGPRAVRAARDQLRPVRGAGFRVGTADPAGRARRRRRTRRCGRRGAPARGLLARRATGGLVVIGPDVEVPAHITVAEVQAAAELLRGVARYTPMESSRPLAQKVGGPVYLKCENLQRTGLVQDPRRVHAHRPAAAGAARAGRRRGVGRQPRPGRRVRRLAARHHGHGLHARGRVDREAGRHPRVRRARGARRRDPGRGAGDRDRVRGSGRAPCWCTRSTIPTCCAVRAPSGSRSSNRFRMSRRWSSRPAAGGCSAACPRTSSRAARTCGSSASRPSRPPPGQAPSTPGGPSGCARCPRSPTVSPSGSRPR